METHLSFDLLPKAVNQLSLRLENIERLLTQNIEQKVSDPIDKLLTIKQASELLSLTIPTIYSKVSKGELPVMKRSKRLYFSTMDLMTYLRQGSKLSNMDIQKLALEYTSTKGGKNG